MINLDRSNLVKCGGKRKREGRFALSHRKCGRLFPATPQSTARRARSANPTPRPKAGGGVKPFFLLPFSHSHIYIPQTPLSSAT